MFKNKEVISSRQAFSMVTLFVIGSATLMAMGLAAKLDVWLAISLAFVFSTILLCMYARILSFLPEKDFYETLETLLGRPITIIIVLFLTWFSFDLGQIVLNNYSQFVVTIGLSETPLTIISLGMSLLCAFAIKFGLEVVGRWSQFFIIPVIAFLLIALTASSKYIDFKNLQPIMYDGFQPVLKGAVAVTSFPFAETVVFLLVFPTFKKSTSPYKVYLYGLYFGGILLLLISILAILAFGPEYIHTLTYPIYEVLSIFKIGTFINRMEILGAAVFCLAIFLKVTILLCGACKGIAYSFNVKNYRLFAFPLALMMVNFNLFSTNSISSYQDFIITGFPLYSSVFEVAIPLFVFILLEVQYRRYKKALKK